MLPCASRIGGIGPEIVTLPLLAVSDDRRARGLKLLNGVLDCLLVKLVKAAVSVIATGGDSLQQFRWPRYTADGLRWYRHFSPFFFLRGENLRG